jgi:diacylglycerol kinase family enzyme
MDDHIIFANPAAGNTTRDEKQVLLKPVAEILGRAPVHGLDTTTREEFEQCIRQYRSEGAANVVFGGDGTFSDALNMEESSRYVHAHLRGGSGNANRAAQRQPWSSVQRAAVYIKEGGVHDLDLVACYWIDETGKPNRRMAVFSSLGIEGHILEDRERYMEETGSEGFMSYALPTARALLNGYHGLDLGVELDGQEFVARNVWSMHVSKHPYFGYVMNVNPRAVWDDGKLHINVMSGRARAIAGAISGVVAQNMFGDHYAGEHVRITSGGTLHLQTDGDRRGETRNAYFEVLPGALHLKCQK